jgi:hypothetical protein
MADWGLPHSKQKRNLLTANWWVVLFVAVCTVVYSGAISGKQAVMSTLDGRLISLQQDKERLINQRQELELQINSQSDPAWIQLTLMKGLGLVPEGQSKVYFHTE